ncbi:hypothetical protein U1Q18_013842 [Sarracenia purpurea var. burkii]
MEALSFNRTGIRLKTTDPFPDHIILFLILIDSMISADSEIIFFPNTSNLEREAKSSTVGGGGVLARGREKKSRKVKQRRVATLEVRIYGDDRRRSWSSRLLHPSLTTSKGMKEKGKWTVG